MQSKSYSEKIKGKFKGKAIIDSAQFSKKDIEIVFKTANRMRKAVIAKGGLDILRRKVMAPLFFEPSTRTFGSFSSAMQRLGGSVIPLPNMQNTSVAKGESFDDTIKVFSAYADIIVIRHPQQGSAQHAGSLTPVPVINAGDGIGEHPTQALYDLYTINEKFKKLDGLHIVFFGELGHYRPVNSLAKLLALYKTKITFVSPAEGKVQTETKNYLTEKNSQFSETDTLKNIVSHADVLYVTRIKKEFMSKELYSKIHGKYIVNKKTLMQMKKKSIIMHALPRIDEIHTEIDEDYRSLYLKSQVKNGLYVRMALLALVLGKA